MECRDGRAMTSLDGSASAAPSAPYATTEAGQLASKGRDATEVPTPSSSAMPSPVCTSQACSVTSGLAQVACTSATACAFKCNPDAAAATVNYQDAETARAQKL